MSGSNDVECFPLLLSRLEDGRPFLPEGADPRGHMPPPPAGIDPPAEDLAQPLHDPGKNLNDLAAQGWAILYPEAQERLLDALRTLIDWRTAELGYAPECIAVPPGLDAHSAPRWLELSFRPRFRTQQAVPLYLLILGELHEISLELQQRLALVHAVGRLALTHPDGTHSLPGYEAYAAKVVHFERLGRQTPATKVPMSVFSTHDGSMAIQHAYAQLIQPLVKRVHADAALDLCPFDLEEHGNRSGNTPDDFLRLAGTHQGGFLFTLSHGIGVPKVSSSKAEEDEQRCFQGSMSFGRSGRLTPEAVGTRPFVPGGVWLYFACFGAGTPALSAYWHWLRALSQDRGGKAVEAVLQTLAPGKPFTSRVSQAALSNPEGPSAMIAHVDLAWQHSYALPGESPELDRFVRLPYHLALGRRVGLAFSELVRERTQRMISLGNAYDRDFRLAQEAHDRACRQALERLPDAAARAGALGSLPPLEWRGAADSALGPRSDPRLLHLWMGYHDLSGFILLGDPATLLPTRADWRVNAPVRPEPSSRGVPAVPPVDPQALERYERVIVECILDGEVPQASARRLKQSRAVLEQWVACYQAAGRAALAALLREPPEADG